MNIYLLNRTVAPARLYTALTIISLLLSAFPAAFFVAEAASTGLTLSALTATAEVDEQVNFVATATTDDTNTTAGTYVAVSDGAGGGDFFTGTIGGDCNSLTPDPDNEFSIGLDKGICYSNSTAGVYDVVVQLLDAPAGTPIGAPAEIEITVTEPACTPQFDVTGPTDVQNTNSGEYFDTVNDALADCDTVDGDTISLLADISTTKQITLDRPIVLSGGGFTIDAAFVKTTNDNNSAVGILADGVTVEDVILDGANGTNLHGVNVYESSDVLLQRITAQNFRSGIVVNSSKVTASDITTGGNIWHAINVDQKTSAPSVLTIRSESTHGEDSALPPSGHVDGVNVPHIFIDDAAKDATVNDEDDQYVSAEIDWRQQRAVVYTLKGEDETNGPNSIDICHANKGVHQFVFQSVNPHSLFGGHGQSGVNIGDIIPAFGDYPGHNLETLYPQFGGITGLQLLNFDCQPPEPPMATVKATKIICEDESLLPNDGYTHITAATAADFLAGLPVEDQDKCRLAEANEFAFQWALGGVKAAFAPNNDGELPVPWMTPVATDENGVATINIPAIAVKDGTTISVREVMDTENYLPFSGTGGSDVTAELYCANDAANYDNLEWIPGVTTEQTYHCVAWNVPVERVSAVTMCKYDEDQTPLAGWNLLLLGEKVDEVEVSAVSGVGADTVSLTGGTPYVAIANGAWDNNRGPLNIVDAEYSTEDNWLTWMDGFTGFPTDILELFINNTPDPVSNWGGYNSAHRYAQAFTPVLDGSANFSINDTYYGDNTGSLNVAVYAGYAGITGENGCVTFENVPFGTYTADEILLDEWENVSGLGETMIDENQEIVSVVNRDTTTTPVATIVAEKIVCTDEEDLPNWNQTGAGAEDITANTAADWVAEHDSCRLEPDWEFEWAPVGTANPDSDLPNSGFYGAAGGDWTTFGPTDGNGVASVSLSEAQIDGAAYVWIREVLQSEYIPFTYGPNNKTNEDDVTAELYCHVDGKNYDNYERVDGIAVGETYHCVAWNSPIPELVQQCELEFFSDTDTVVVEPNAGAVETYDGHSSWTADIPGATWVWATDFVENPTQSETYTFTETFTVDNPSSALLDIAADNGYVVLVNDVVVLDRSEQEVNYRDFTTKYDVDLLPYLNLTGENELKIVVTNFALSGGTVLTNPAGVLYRVNIVGETGCGVTTEREPETYLISGYKLEQGSDYLAFVEGWTIDLKNGEGELLMSTTTDSNGFYAFSVTPGDYQVHEGMESDWLQVSVRQGGELVETDADIEFCSFTLTEEDVECEFTNEFDSGDSDTTDDDQTDNDEDESNERSGGRSYSSGQRIRLAQPQPLVLGAATAKCGMLLQDYMKAGQENDEYEVTRLQFFLNGQGWFIPVTGVFDAATDQAVRAFQAAHKIDVLDPWVNAGHMSTSHPTGWVYQLTRWKINNMVCPGAEPFPVLIP